MTKHGDRCVVGRDRIDGLKRTRCRDRRVNVQRRFTGCVGVGIGGKNELARDADRLLVHRIDSVASGGAGADLDTIAFLEPIGGGGGPAVGDKLRTCL